MGLRQQARETGRPISLSVRTGDQILTDLDQHVMQAAALGMYRDGVVRHVAHDIRRVGADEKTLFRIEERHEVMGETRIAIVEHAGMPGPRCALENRREAMKRDQRRRTAGLPPTVQLGFDPLVIGPENLARARPWRLRSSRRYPGSEYVR